MIHSNDDILLNGLKACLNYPENVHDFDDSLRIYLNGSHAYIDDILDNPDKAQGDPLYTLAIIHTALFNYESRDNSKPTQMPIELSSIINKLKSKYLD